MDATEGMKKAIADRKDSQAKALKVLDVAVKELQANRHIQKEAQHRPE